MRQRIATERKLLTVPPDAAAGRLAPRYRSAALGEIAGAPAPAATVTFDFGEWKTPVAVAQEPRRHHLLRHHRPRHDRPASSSSARPPAPAPCVFRDAQHQYVFTES